MQPSLPLNPFGFWRGPYGENTLGVTLYPYFYETKSYDLKEPCCCTYTHNEIFGDALDDFIFVLVLFFSFLVKLCNKNLYKYNMQRLYPETGHNLKPGRGNGVTVSKVF